MPTYHVVEVFSLLVFQEVLSPLQRWLMMVRNFRRSQLSSLRRNSHQRKLRKVGTSTFPFFSFGIWSSTLLKWLVLLHFASTCPMLKYMPPTLRHRSQVATKSQIQPWHTTVNCHSHCCNLHVLLYPFTADYCLLFPHWLPLVCDLESALLGSYSLTKEERLLAEGMLFLNVEL